MSSANVDLIRETSAAFNAHDIERWSAFFDPGCDFVDHAAAVAEGAGSGLDDLRRLAEGWIETFPDFRAETSELIDAGDRVVSVTHWQGTGAKSGLPFSQHSAEVFTIRDGRIVRLEMGFESRTAAVTAAGLSA